MDAADKAFFLADMGRSEPGLNRVISAAYTLLGLRRNSTAGPKEARAWRCAAARDRAPGRGRHPHRFRARLFHPRGSDRYRITSPTGRAGREGSRAHAPRRQDDLVEDGDVIFFRFKI